MRIDNGTVGWFVLLLVREEVLLAGLCERKILFRLKIYDHLRQATAKRTGCWLLAVCFYIGMDLILAVQVVYRVYRKGDWHSDTNNEKKLNFYASTWIGQIAISCLLNSLS